MPGFRDGVAAALKRPAADIELLSIERTDAAWSALVEHREVLEPGTAWATVMVTVRSSTRREVEAGLDAMAVHLEGLTLYLHRGLSEICGAVVVPGADLLEHVFDLVELDQEAVAAADETADTGLVLEYLTDPIGFGEPTLRLLGWAGFHSVAAEE